jgi:2-polyprenyl-6-methoxyphenol hydroxylase-like FAD-dependent oxidoreductase
LAATANKQELPVDKSYDVVVVGGGIAGGALAHVLARAGLSVLVLERDVSYRDKVRGEFIPPWGVKELQSLGLLDCLLAAGGRIATRIVPYDEVLPPEAAEHRGSRIGKLIEGVPGSLNVGHPEACEALNRAARAAGADVLCGVESVRVLATSPAPELSFVYEEGQRHVRARLLIGADGRQSTVRKQLGLGLQETIARTALAGLLVRQHVDEPTQPSCAGTSHDAYYLSFPRAHGLTRLYIQSSVDQRQRFAGAQGTQRFLENFRTYCSPYADMLGRSEPVGPCATHTMTDSLVQEPLADNAVLIGDAAGWNDPIIGQGISIAMRDVRLVSRILLQDRSDWSKPRFTSYVQERTERMRRLRIAARIATDMRCTFTDASRKRREAWFANALKQPWSAATALAPLIGPSATPAEGYEPDAIERVITMQL